MARTRRVIPDPDQPDLFTGGPSNLGLRFRLARMDWPPPARLPVNHANSDVHSVVWRDLLTARAPLVVAGYASLENIVALVAAREDSVAGRPPMRILLGSEPFVRDRPRFGSATATFTEEVRHYWTEAQGISLALSAKVVQTIEASQAGRVQVRFVPGATRMHAKIYLGDTAATVGSSNFTLTGMHHQLEANVRFRAGEDGVRFAEVAGAATNYWEVGEPWDEEFRALLQGLLRFVPWREALARACADLLEGQWAARYLPSDGPATELWPSQVAGIAEAMWIVESVGSVLVADATGSGKTRMGAHLTRAVRDRLWSTGRVRRDLTVLVCPPAVETQWAREATFCGLSLLTVSQGLLSRAATSGARVEDAQVARAQVLAIDEAHNFLSTASNRTAKVRESGADHVLMFTATPINRGTQDLLALVDLLGADNFSDDTLRILDGLAKRGSDAPLSDDDRSRVREEIQRFTVRRTKARLNALVDREPALYKHPVTGRPCRYPEHVMKTYPTGESASDERCAEEIRVLVTRLRGVTLLGDNLAVPPALRRDYTDERWLELRLGAARGLAAHNVLSSMRSSKAALLEHLIGTKAAIAELSLPALSKPQPSGDQLARVAAILKRGKPTCGLSCDLPEWLADGAAWLDACREEEHVYREILEAARALSTLREFAKADKIRRLTSRKHARVLAFDHHPITLAVIASHLEGSAVPVTVATGGDTRGRREMLERFARDSTTGGIGLCSDAMNEGINLQGASAVVQLDMPTTLRVAEQRVGRVDRMDSVHDRIEVWWPDDGPAFATHANELLVARNAESSALLGSNLPVPDFVASTEAVVRAEDFIRADQDERTATWDGIHDALEPVRRLVDGPDALLTPAEYELHRGTTHRVLARISPVRTRTAWAFLAIAGTKHGAPRWMLLEADRPDPSVGVDIVSTRLRELLAEDPPDRKFDEESEHLLIRFLERARIAEVALLPRRTQRALTQMAMSCRHWRNDARHRGEFELADRWDRLAQLAVVDPHDERGEAVDLYQVAEAWLHLVRPLRDQYRRKHRRRRYVTLSDLDDTLRATALPVSAIEDALSELEFVEPIDRRISACILGVPGEAQ